MKHKKQKLSKLLCFVMALLTVVSAMPFAAYAEGERYTASGNPMDFSEYEEITNAVIEDDEELDYKIIRVTYPCTVYASFVCRNEEQTATDTRPMPFSLNYELLLNHEKTGWNDTGKPNFENSGGDFEYVCYEVTAEDIEAAGGEFVLYCRARAAMSPNQTLEQLGQNVHFDIKVYNTFGIDTAPKTDSVTLAGNVVLDKENPYALADENGEVAPATADNCNIFFNCTTGTLTLDNVTIAADREDFTTDAGAVKAVRLISFANTGNAGVQVIGNVNLEYTGDDTLGSGNFISHSTTSREYDIEIFGGGTLNLCGGNSVRGVLANNVTVTDTAIHLDITGTTVLEAYNDLTIKNAVITAKVTANPNGPSICSQHGMTIENSDVRVNMYEFEEDLAVIWVFGGTADATDRFLNINNSRIAVNQCDDSANTSLRAIHANHADVEFNNSTLICDTTYGISGSANRTITAMDSDIEMESADKYAIAASYVSLCNETKITGKVSGTQTVAEYNNGICEACGAYEDGIGARLAGYTLSLKGNIGVNFHMQLSSDTASSENTYMQFTLPDGRTKKTDITDAEKSVVNGKEYYVFSCEVPAKNMTDIITAQMFDGEKAGTVYTYSVKEYAEYLLAHQADSEEYADAAAMVKAMLNYGSYAQVYFKNTANGLANDSEYITEEEKAVSSVTAEMLEQYKNQTSRENDFVKFEGSNLSLLSQTALRLWFTFGNEAIADSAAFTCEGEPLTAVQSGSYYYAEITDIAAQDLDKAYTLTVSYGGEALDVSFSVMAYCYDVLSRETTAARTQALKNTVAALYLYNAEANNYFGA